MTKEKALWIVNRVFAWALVPVMAVNFLSGYASVHPRLFGWLIAKPRAFRLHLAVQPLAFALVLYHVVFHVRRALMRRGAGGPLLDAAAVLCWAAGSGLAFWLGRLG
jgi:hypothetical protein